MFNFYPRPKLKGKHCRCIGYVVQEFLRGFTLGTPHVLYSYCTYCSTYYVHVVWLENTTNRPGNRGLPCKSPFTPGHLIDAPPPEWPRTWVKASPRPPPLLPGALWGLPLSPPVTSLLLIPGMSPEYSQKLPPSPSPSPGAGTGKGAPPFNVPFRPL